MSELLIENPISIIEKLLKLGLGDEGRLLYLRKSIRSGKRIYESDKKFLKKMQTELDNYKIKKLIKSGENHFGNSVKNPKALHQEEKSISEVDPDIEKIQTLLAELKISDSKLMDNLEILLLSREGFPEQKEEKPISSFSNILKNHNADLFEMIKNSPVSETKILKIKKYDIFAAASAGLFTLWFAGYQNLIDLGPLQGLVLGLCAGAAVLCGIFFKKEKSKNSILK